MKTQLLCSTLTIIYTLCIDCTVTKQHQKPNVIIFVADDMGWDDVGFHGSVQMQTPNIDALAADGVILNNFYASPVCTPSRGSLLSGIHPIHSGTQNYVILPPSPWGLPLNHKLLPEYLKKYNYSSHAVGKWHLGFYKREYTPTFRGFDSHVGYWTGAGDYYDHTALFSNQYWGLDFRHNLDLITNATGIYSTNYFTERAKNLISAHNTSQPIFLYIAYQSVHTANSYAKLQAPKKYVDMFNYIRNIDRRSYAAMAYAMDESIGIIIDALFRRNMLENSVIIFISDNGGPAHGFAGNAASNWPLRGVKATLWEGGIRVPAFLWSPMLNKSGYASNAMIHITDLLPTILDAIDLNWNKTNHLFGQHIYGMSQWDTLSNKSPSPRTEILHNIDPIWNVSAIRYKQWKLIQGLVFPDWNLWFPTYNVKNYGLNNSYYKSFQAWNRNNSLTHKALVNIKRYPNYEIIDKNVIFCGPKPKNASSNCKPDVEPCLFDINADPCEYKNLANQYPEVTKFLWNKILEYNKTAVVPLSQPIDPKADPKLHRFTWSYWQDLFLILKYI